MTNRLSNLCYTKFDAFGDDEVLWSEGAQSWIEKWDAISRYHVFQLERCPKTKKLHYQGYLQLKRQQRFSAIKKIDGTMHIEEQLARWNAESAEYCKKTETWVAGPWESGVMKRNIFAGGSKNPSRAADEDFAEAFSAPTVAEGISILRQKRPRDMAMHGEAIERNLKRAKKTIFVPKYTIESFDLPAIIFDKSTLVWGPSGIGKTQYVLSHFQNPLLVSHMDKLKELSPDHDGIVFDDMAFDHYPPEAVIHLLDIDLEREIHVRYGIVSIPANTVKVFVHNKENPFYKCDVDESQQEAIERRLKRVYVTKKCFTIRNSNIVSDDVL